MSWIALDKYIMKPVARLGMQKQDLSLWKSIRALLYLPLALPSAKLIQQDTKFFKDLLLQGVTTVLLKRADNFPVVFP